MNIKKNIAIIGCGWLGLPLASYFFNRGWRVFGSSRSEKKIEHLNNQGIDGFQLVLGEDFKCSSKDFLTECEVLILNIPPGRYSGYEEKVVQLLNLISGSQIKYILFVGSTSVFANISGLVGDTELPKPDTEKQKEIYRSEQIISNHIDFSSTVVRFGGLIGYDRHPGKFLSGRKSVPNPNHKVNLIHRDDCVEILYEIVSQHKWGAIYNACGTEHPTRKDFYEKAAGAIGAELPQFIEDSKMEGKVIDSSKMLSDLRYKMKYPNPLDCIF